MAHGDVCVRARKSDVEVLEDGGRAVRLRRGDAAGRFGRRQLPFDVELTALEFERARRIDHHEKPCALGHDVALEAELGTPDPES